MTEIYLHIVARLKVGITCMCSLAIKFLSSDCACRSSTAFRRASATCTTSVI